VLGVLLRPAARCGGGQRGGGRLTSQPAFRLRFYARGRKARSRFSTPQARETVENPSQWQARLRCCFAKVAENMKHFRPARRRLSCVTSHSATSWHGHAGCSSHQDRTVQNGPRTDGVREMTGKLQGTQYNPEALRVFIVCRPP
jgi:hypothetical protein